MYFLSWYVTNKCEWLKQLSMVGVKLQLCNLAVCIFARAVTKEVKFPTERTSYTNLAARVCSRVLGSNEIL